VRRQLTSSKVVATTGLVKAPGRHTWCRRAGTGARLDGGRRWTLV